MGDNPVVTDGMGAHITLTGEIMGDFLGVTEQLPAHKTILTAERIMKIMGESTAVTDSEIARKLHKLDTIETMGDGPLATETPAAHKTIAGDAASVTDMTNVSS